MRRSQECIRIQPDRALGVVVSPDVLNVVALILPPHNEQLLAGQLAQDDRRVRSHEDGETNSPRAKASRSKKAGWFKSVTWMESAARDIVGPDLPDTDPKFRSLVEEIFEWASDGGG